MVRSKGEGGRDGTSEEEVVEEEETLFFLRPAQQAVVPDGMFASTPKGKHQAWYRAGPRPHAGVRRGDRGSAVGGRPIGFPRAGWAGPMVFPGLGVGRQGCGSIHDGSGWRPMRSVPDGARAQEPATCGRSPKRETDAPEEETMISAFVTNSASRLPCLPCLLPSCGAAAVQAMYCRI